MDVSKITVWGRDTSYNVQRVLWTLDELSLVYEHRNAGGSFGGLDTPEFLAMNPHGRVPVLRDGDTVVWESNAIVRYLAAHYGSATLWQESAAERALADGWMDWSATTLQADFIRLFWSYYRTPSAQRDEKVISNLLASCQKHFRVLDGYLATRNYLAGAQFSMADIPAGSILHRYFTMGLEVERPSNVLAWYARLQERPAFQKQIAQVFDALFGRLAY
ncbi:glutathione S-transferase family protein [Undibacterium umbellatum]|uniref:Glutathione S-transferase N-terminal domain-containing protein n=1 Tax=Undibacterium umbellatum TaxID=2762300 RepID=A0ABR6Z9Y1_9BURK|nr:glutathione S-transferase N-terminal domain-containing protein [Undibacterium umbellatum]MBC3908568.1 glutathione S-transferase N-terminal domain-containing protein [Undibacterium umbellatum]